MRIIRRIKAMQLVSHASDELYQTQPVKSWEVVQIVPPFGPKFPRLRLQVTCLNGNLRILAPSFTDRNGLDKYIARFHKDFAGKEVIGANTPVTDASVTARRTQPPSTERLCRLSQSLQLSAADANRAGFQ
jgi:hypothetical protein